MFEPSPREHEASFEMEAFARPSRTPNNPPTTKGSQTLLSVSFKGRRIRTARKLRQTFE